MQTTLFRSDQLFEVVESIWDSMLGLPVSMRGGEGLVHDAAGLIASVQISGAWNGVVLFLPTERFARRAATLMLAKDQLETAELLDAVAELCNMIGGGIKTMLPGPSHLSLPTIMQGTQYAVHVPKTRLIAQLKFSSESQTQEVRVLEGICAEINL